MSVLQLDCRRRGADGRVGIAPTQVPAARVGVVVIDMWNGYPCCTGRGLFAALVPRMNRALAGMRAAGSHGDPRPERRERPVRGLAAGGAGGGPAALRDAAGERHPRAAVSVRGADLPVRARHRLSLPAPLARHPSRSRDRRAGLPAGGPGVRRRRHPAAARPVPGTGPHPPALPGHRHQQLRGEQGGGHAVPGACRPGGDPGPRPDRRLRPLRPGQRLHQRRRHGAGGGGHRGAVLCHGGSGSGAGKGRPLAGCASGRYGPRHALGPARSALPVRGPVHRHPHLPHRPSRRGRSAARPSTTPWTAVPPSPAAPRLRARR